MRICLELLIYIYKYSLQAQVSKSSINSILYFVTLYKLECCIKLLDLFCVCHNNVNSEQHQHGNIIQMNVTFCFTEFKIILFLFLSPIHLLFVFVIFQITSNQSHQRTLTLTLKIDVDIFLTYLLFFCFTE